MKSIIMAEEGGVEAFGEQLRMAREERGMTVEAICDATKVSRQEYSRSGGGSAGGAAGRSFSAADLCAATWAPWGWRKAPG